MEKITFRETKRELEDIYPEVYLTKVIGSDPTEYKVNFRGGSELTAYYTNDLQDAFDTGEMMAKEHEHINGQCFKLHCPLKG